MCIATEPGYLKLYRKHQDQFEKEVREEYVLNEDNSRLSAFPIDPRCQDIHDLYENMLQVRWTHKEIQLMTDREKWMTLPKRVQHPIQMVNAFFQTSDAIVNHNVNHMLQQLTPLEIQMALQEQGATEVIHNISYSMFGKLFSTEEEFEILVNSVRNSECIRRKAEWCYKWLNEDSRKTPAHNLAAFAAVEGVYFSGAFAFIFWLMNNPDYKLDGYCATNGWISRDEAMHVALQAKIYRKLNNRLKQEVVHEMYREAVEIEAKFIDELLPQDLLGMNAKLMKQYSQYCADYILVMMGYEKLFFVEQPFSFMKYYGLEIITDFFTGVVTQYAGTPSFSSYSNVSDHMKYENSLTKLQSRASLLRQAFSSRKLI